MYRQPPESQRTYTLLPYTTRFRSRVAAFDLAQERLTCFCAFRVRYERLLGAEVRPWLPSAFCAAASLPQIRPERRKVLLQSLSEAAATAPGWSDRKSTRLNSSN